MYVFIIDLHLSVLITNRNFEGIVFAWGPIIEAENMGDLD
jgi:hypothetical protein